MILEIKLPDILHFLNEIYRLMEAGGAYALTFVEILL